MTLKVAAAAVQLLVPRRGILYENQHKDFLRQEYRMDYKERYEAIKATLDAQKEKVRLNYEANKDKKKEAALTYYHEHKEEINKRKREARIARRLVAEKSPA